MQDKFKRTARRFEIRRVPNHPTKETSRRETPSIQEIYPLVVQAESRKKILKAQDEEKKLTTLKRFLRNEFDKMTYERVNYAEKAWTVSY